VTKKGTDQLLPEEENTAQTIEPPTEEEMNSAITSNMGNLLVVVRLSDLPCHGTKILITSTDESRAKV
jgi:hypothetical protein